MRVGHTTTCHIFVFRHHFRYSTAHDELPNHLSTQPKNDRNHQVCNGSPRTKRSPRLVSIQSHSQDGFPESIFDREDLFWSKSLLHQQDTKLGERLDIEQASDPVSQK